jgi:chromosomal replication initiation ATPase DnaA
VNRLDQLRSMRDFLDREIAIELDRLGEMSAHVEGIILRACALYNAEAQDVRAGRRDRQSSSARHGAAWLLRRHGLSLPQIGVLLGCDHSTVFYACRKVEASPGAKALLIGLEVVA